MIIFLYGDDSFRSLQKLKEIRNKYLTSDKSGSGLSLFDFEEKARVFEAISVFGMPNLLAPKRLIIIKNIISAASLDEQKKMGEYLKNEKSILDDKDLVVVFWEKESPKKSNSFFKLLTSKEAIRKQEFKFLSGARLDQWIINKIKELDEKTTISKTALEKLIVFIGPDANVLHNEINKLVNFSPGRMINEKDVEMLVKSKIDSNIFTAIDALGVNNKKEAIKTLYDNLEKGEDPFYIFSMIVYQFRNMVKIADLKERGVDSEYEISRLTKMHPFVIRKTLAQTRIFSFEKLKKIYKKLAHLDTAVKTGRMEMKIVLDKFVAEL